MKYDENKICCLNCQFLVKSYNKRYKILFEINRFYLLESIANKPKKEVEEMYCCYKGIWQYNHLAKEKEEDIFTLQNLIDNRTLDECFFLKYQPNRSLEVSEKLQEREYKRRESQKQWFVTILALTATVIVSLMGIIFDNFLDNASIFWKAMVLVAFVLFGYSIFNVLKVKLWDNRI